MREYELTYLVSDDVLEADLKKITDKVAGVVFGEGGKVTKEEIWGRRKLTYPIKKQTFATYITVWFEIEKTTIGNIDHELRVNPLIIRHLITVKVAKDETLKVTREDIVGADEVGKVIGEKSFELIKGQTEKSYDLMSKRLETEEEKVAEKKIIEEPAKGSKIKESKSKKNVIETHKEEIETPIIKLPKAKKPVSEKEINKEDEVGPSRQSEDEADRIKKLDEKLDELLKDDL